MGRLKIKKKKKKGNDGEELGRWGLKLGSQMW